MHVFSAQSISRAYTDENGVSFTCLHCNASDPNFLWHSIHYVSKCKIAFIFQKQKYVSQILLRQTSCEGSWHVWGVLFHQWDIHETTTHWWFPAEKSVIIYKFGGLRLIFANEKPVHTGSCGRLYLSQTTWAKALVRFQTFSRWIEVKTCFLLVIYICYHGRLKKHPYMKLTATQLPIVYCNSSFLTFPDENDLLFQV